MNFFVCGYYGGRNFGDEFLLKKIISDIESISNNPKHFYIWTSDKKFTRSLLNKENVSCIDRFSIEETTEAIKKSDIIIYGGGGLLQEYYGLYVKNIFSDFGIHVASYIVPALIGKIYDKKIFIWSIGHGPVYTSEGKAISGWFYSLSDIITVRDNYSFLSIKQLVSNKKNVIMDVDPLINYDFKKYRVNITKKENEILGINIRNWVNNKILIKNLAAVLNKITEKYKNIKILPIPFDLKNDPAILKMLIKSLRSDIVIKENINNIEQIPKLVYKCDWFIGMRLHSMILAHHLEKPSLAISYDIKTEEYLKSAGIEEIKYSDESEESIYNKVSKLITENFVGKKEEYNYKTPTIFKNFITALKENNQEKDIIPIDINTLKVDNNSSMEEKYTSFFCETLIKNIQELKAEIEQQRQQIKKEQEEKDAIRVELTRNIQELKEIQNSNWWKMAVKYYQVRENTFIRHLYPYYKPFLDSLFRKKHKNIESADINSDINNANTHSRLNEILKFLESDRKTVVMLSAIPFDETLNQRPLNLSKEFSKKGYSVLFVVYQYYQENTASRPKYVSNNIFEISLEDFMYIYKGINKKKEETILYVTFPEAKIQPIIRQLRSAGFKIIYDMMDDWEGFFKANQASWYEKDYEEEIILESDFVISVNDYLKSKFSFLRSDIEVVGNGYDIETIGVDSKFIAASTETEKPIMGYVGWLNKNRFDWDFVFSLAEATNYLDIELVGYGIQDDILEKIKNSNLNIRYKGKVHPSKLMSFVKNWNMGIIPFVDGAISQGSDPLKIYQYIYFGLPTLIKGCNSIADYPLVFSVNNFQDAIRFVENFKKRESVLHFREENLNKINNFLKQSLWNNRADSILKVLDKKVLYK